MAVRRFSPKRITGNRLLSASSSSSIAATDPQNFSGKSEPSILKSTPEILNMEDSGKLFSSVPLSQLLKSTLNLHIATVDPFVEVGIQLMKSRLMEKRVFGGAVMAIVKRTVYDHFCAGDGLEEASRTLQRLWENGLQGILDYGLEDASDNDGCDRNLVQFLNTVDMTSSLPPSSVSFACVKITAICPVSLLERMSDLLRWERNDPSFDLPWKLDSLPIFSDSSPLYHTPSKPEPLTENEQHDLQMAHQRLAKLCKKCIEINLPLLVDAEYTSVQPAIDYFTYWAAMQFNKDDRPVVYGTIQAYLKDAKDRLIQAVQVAKMREISIGFKLVRGAYMTRETAQAASLGAAPPIHASIWETHECYHECMSFMLQNIANGHVSVVLATHNLESGKLAAAKADELKIGKRNPNLQFAQLKGMADGISYGLRNAGFNVSKYLPFGPVEKVIPYLVRRAEENRGLLSASELDRKLLRKELKRRLKVAILGSGLDKVLTENSISSVISPK